MATSKVAISNLALQKLGAKRIESLSQDSPNAKSMNAAYAAVRDAELRRYTWGFSIKRESIAADSVDSVWGDWNRFSKPNDFLRLIRDDESGSTVDWRTEGLYILSKTAAPLEIRYVASVDDPNYYDSLFIEAFACKLAWQCCKEITGSSDLKATLMDDFSTAVAEAKRVGAIEKEAQEFPEDDWVSARL